jgi:hypothetical protein
MAKVTAKLNAAQATEKFSNIKGTIMGAKLFGDHVALLDMGRGAKAVIINGNMDCCCPNATMAMVQVERALRIVAKHLSGTVRC